MANSDSAFSGDNLESIPGLGIIRARGLRKAGYADIPALRKASLEELTAVPGITANKAAQILAHLQDIGARQAAARSTNMAPTTRKPATRRTVGTAGAPQSTGRRTGRAAVPPKPVTRRTRAVTASKPVEPAAAHVDVVFEQSPAPQPVPVIVVKPAATSETVQESARHLAELGEGLLGSSRASRYEPRLARQIGKAVALGRVLEAGFDVSHTKMDRLIERLNGMAKTLESIGGMEKLGSRRQDRLADDLRDIRRKIEGSIESRH